MGGVVPDFDGVDDVLPQDVAAGSDGGHGTEVHVGHPDAEAGVLLEQCLAGVDFRAQVSANASANGKLQETEQQRRTCLSKN